MKNPSLKETATHLDPLALLEAELGSGLRLYWQSAGKILHDSPVQLIEPDRATVSLSRNFFSALFMYSYHRAGITRDRRILYAAVNQCLRGMVTGCDNLLDDEYKVTLETDLPRQAKRFRSVLDIMVSDRILTEILLEYLLVNDLPVDRLVQAGRASLHALLLSGVEEASEEGGGVARLPPDDILTQIHHYKTGVLFQCAWAVPAVFEDDIHPIAIEVKEALYNIGMGCQILDDMVDIVSDLRENRHNYALSIIFHQEHPEIWDRLVSQLAATASPDVVYAEFPELHAALKAKALQFLGGGLQRLFSPEHLFLVDPAVAFIAGRIGVKLGED